MRKHKCQPIGTVIASGHCVPFGNGDKADAVRKDDRLDEYVYGHLVRASEAGDRGKAGGVLYGASIRRVQEETYKWFAHLWRGSCKYGTSADVVRHMSNDAAINEPRPDETIKGI